MSKILRIGTRGSALALVQARWVQARLAERFPELSTELVVIKTLGDIRQDHPLDQQGRKGFYTREIEEQLSAYRIDCAVHSMKDLPSALAPGFVIAAVPEREWVEDALVSRRYSSFAMLPQGARIGTSSLRRATQLQHRRPDLEIVPLRGNVDTRLRKLDEQSLDAIILAAAGLRRLGLAEEIKEILSTDLLIPAAAQGALAIECRHDDPLLSYLTFLDHAPSHAAVRAERACMVELSGGCEVPIAGFAQVADAQIALTAVIASLDGRTLLRATAQGSVEQPELLGQDVAKRLFAQGAADVLAAIQHGLQARLP